MNRRELIPKVGRGVEGTNNVEVGQNSSNLSKRVLDAVRAFSLVAALGVVGAPNKSAEASQGPVSVLQGDPSDSIVDGHYGPISSTNQPTIVNGRLVVSNTPSTYLTAQVSLNNGSFFDSSGNLINIPGINDSFSKEVVLPNACFGTSNVNGSSHLFFVDLISNTSIDLTSQYGVIGVAEGFFTNDNEVMIYAGQGKPSFRVNIHNNSIVTIPYNPTIEQRLYDSANGRLNKARLALGSQNISRVGISLVSETGIRVVYRDSDDSIVLYDPEVEQVEAPAPVITLEDAYILNTNNQTLRFSVANFIAGDTVELEYLGLKITGLVANANGEVSYTFTEQDFVKIGKNECTGLVKVAVLRDGQEVASGESDLVLDMVAPQPIGVSIEGDDVVVTENGFKFEIDSAQSSVTRGVVFEKPIEMGSESTVSVAKISMDELDDIDLEDQNEIRTRILSIMTSIPQVEELNDDDFDSSGKALRNFEFSKGDFALVTITVDPAGNSSVALKIVNVVEKASGEDMGPVETDMGGGVNNPDMSVEADQGVDVDMGGNPSTPVQPKTGSEDGPTCTVVSPTAPMHKTPGGLTLLFASALTAAAGFRKKGEKGKKS